MIDSVFQVLFKYDGAIAETQIHKILDISCEDQIDLLHAQLKTDNRFVSAPNDKWKIAPLDNFLEDISIENINFIITDIETTGSIKGRDRIIDLAAIRVQNGVVLDRFDMLVDPQKRISPTISSLTGISTADVQNAPFIEEVMPKYIEFSKNGLFAAHNSSFDFNFINYESKRLGLGKLPSIIDLCTLRLARKLIPEIRSHGITGLSNYFDYEIKNRHRAMPDVIATKYYLDQFFEKLSDLHIDSLIKLIDFQRDKLSLKSFRKKLNRHLRKRFHQRVGKK